MASLNRIRRECSSSKMYFAIAIDQRMYEGKRESGEALWTQRAPGHDKLKIDC